MESPDAVKAGLAVQDGAVLRVHAHPVARVALPMQAALNLAAELCSTVFSGMPNVITNVNSFGERMSSLAAFAGKVAEQATAPQDRTPESQGPDKG